MDKAGAVDVRALFGVDLEAATGPCSRCGESFFVDSLTGNGAGELLCRGCNESSGESERVKVEAADIFSRLGAVVRGWLERAGMTEAEAVNPEIDRTRFPVLDRLLSDPKSSASASALMGGAVPLDGFGVQGTAGVGKTFALAALFRAAALVWIDKAAASHGWAAVRPTPWLSWLHWPAVARDMRATSMRDGGHAEIESLMERWCAAPAVVLDDVGAERIPSGRDYLEDFVTSQLDLLVGARERAGLPTWYTTNLEEEALFDRYGARLFSRLVRRNPLVVYGSGRDLRAPAMVGGSHLKGGK